MEIMFNLYYIFIKNKNSLLKINKKSGHTKNNIIIQLLFFIIIIFFQIDISKEKTIYLRKFNLESEIIMTFNSIGDQKIISDYYQYLPDEIYSNGNLLNREGNIIKGLATYTITMKWNHLLNTCNFMFAHLSNIIRMDLSNFDTSLVTDMNGMFLNCYSLTSLNLTNFRTSSVTTMLSMFYSCYSLKSLDLSSFNTSLITSIYAMFYNCSTLTSLDLSNFDTSLVTNMQGTFHDCASLKSLNVKSFNTSSVKTLHLTFYNCSSLTSLDVSNFDTSLVDDMQGTFGQCQSLISLNLSNFKTSKVNNMEGMFGGSYSLLLLDLSNFDISHVTNMLGMFLECKSLVFLNMDSFKEINNQYSVINVQNMFSYNPNLKLCINRENNQNIYQALISTNLNNNNNCNDICFNDFIKIDVNENYCTEECETNKYEYNNLCFESCPENTHISPNNNHTCEEDLNCEKLNKYYNYEKTSCINNIPEGYFINNESLKTIDKCHIDCKTCEEKYNENNSNCKTCLNDKILDLGNCVSSCINDFFIDSSGNKICKCSYNSKCYECSNESNELELCISCNDGYYQKSDEESNEKGFINCYKDPDGYYLDKDIYKPCSQNCKNCTNSEDINNNKCLECYSDYLLENGQCYEICQYYYYFDSSNQYHCSDYDRCPFEYSKLIKEKKKCISNCIDDDIYKHEIDNICYKSNPEETTLSDLSDNPNETDNSDTSNIPSETEKANYNINEIECPDNNPYKNKNNECIQKCNATDFFNEICKINNNSSKTLDDMINTIKNQLSNGTLNSLLSNVLDGEKNDLLVVSNNINYQITTTDNQNNKNYTNISTIKLGDCEDILKEKYKIDKNKTLLILKIDYYMEGLYIPVINYEVYNPDTKEKLDLNYCKETFIDLDIPVSIDENNLFKYDPNSDYYTDDCYPYTTDNGTDIILNDRKEEFIDNNMSLCENKCNYNGYNGESKKASCECEVKSEQSSINEIENNDNILSNNFTFDNSTSNMKTMKCTSTLFSKDGLLNNIANYILIVIIISYVILIILYFKVGYYLIDKDIKTLLSEKEKNAKNINIFNINKKRHKKKSKVNTDVIQGNPLRKKKRKNTIEKTNYSIKNKKYNFQTISKIELKNTNILINLENDNSNYIRTHKNKKTTRCLKLSSNNFNFINFHIFYDSEMNYFPYKMALQFDKRRYLNYYISLLKTKHPLIFPFISKKDYNIVIIKISILLLSYVIYFGINTLFFNTLTIHKIYEDQGNYNLQYHINPIICSFFISHFICCIIKYISLSERNLLKIKYQITYEKANLMADEVRKCIFIKYICFYVLSLGFIIFFWYYLSSFCAVYQNSQLFLFINTIISCGISFLYPLFINIFPGIFRIISLERNRNSKCLYITSQVFQFL